MRLPRPFDCFFAAVALFSLATASGSAAFGQQSAGMGGDPMREHLFPPELVMSHQRQIALDADQRQQLIEEVQALQSEIVPWQVEMREASEALIDLLANAVVNETAVLAVAERITGLEARIKRRHLMLLIRIKNMLNVEQQSLLKKLR